MKRFLYSTLAALAVMVVSQQQAKAWFNFSLGGSANMNVSWGGLKGCWNWEQWPTTAYGAPQYSWYGPANSGPPPYPVNPYGMQSYGGIGGAPGFVPPPPHPADKGPGGSPSSFNYVPQPMGYGFASPYYGNPSMVQPAVYQPASPAQSPYYWYNR